MTAVGVVATGSYLPKGEVLNDEVAALVGVDPEWIERKTRIRTRRWAAPHEATSDLAVRAAEDALDRAGLTADAIDYLILSTGTGDAPQPPTSYLVQDALGARNAACFDINVACSAFVYGMQLSRSLIALRPDARALVVSAELQSRFGDFSDRRTAVLLGDGAAAAVLAAVPEPYGIVDVELVSRGDAQQLIRIEAGGSRRPASHETVDAGGHFIKMDGRGVTEFVLANLPGTLARLADRAGIGLHEVDHFVPHQPNGVLLDNLVTACGLDRARTHRTVERYANVGSASVPLTLDDAHRAGAFRPGDLVLINGFGSGMGIAACLLRWGGDS